MPTWNKLIVSGSDAELNNLFVDNSITASSFVGDGSQLVNISGSPGGSNNEIQYNNNGNLEGAPDLTYISSSQILNVPNKVYQPSSNQSTYFGDNAGQSTQDNVLSQYNTGIGHSSLSNSISGSENTAIGYNSLGGIGNQSSSQANVAIGFQAGNFTSEFDSFLGQYITNFSFGNNNIFIGPNTRPSSSGDNNEIIIGSDVNGLGSNTTIIGNDFTNLTVLKGNIGIGTNSPSHDLEVQGTSSINQTITSTLLITGSQPNNVSKIDKQQTTTTSTLEVVSSVISTNVDAVLFDYVVKDGTGQNKRTGTVYVVIGPSVKFTETSTVSIGDTSEVKFDVNLQSSQVQLIIISQNTGWIVKTLTRTL